MVDRNDQSYFERRARQERAIASVSEDNSVALTHLKMADAYERRLIELAKTGSSQPLVSASPSQ